MKFVKGDQIQVNIVHSKAPLLVKFGYISVTKRNIPKVVATLCYIISQLQMLALMFRIGFFYLPQKSTSITKPFEIFYKSMTITDFFNEGDATFKSWSLAVMFTFLMFICLLIGFTILIKLIKKKTIPLWMKNVWGLVCYFHPLVIFFPIHVGSLKAINYFHNVGAPVGTGIYLYLTCIVNFLLAFLNSAIFQSIMKTKDPLCAKSTKLRRSELLTKTFVPLFMLFDSQVTIYITFFSSLAWVIHRKFHFYTTLPYYRVPILLITATFYGPTAMLITVATVLRILFDLDLKVDINLFVLTFILLLPISLKITINQLHERLGHLVSSGMDNLGPELIIQKRYLAGFLLKSISKPNTRQSRFSIFSLLFAGKLTQFSKINLKLDSKKEVLATQGHMLITGVNLYPDSALLKLTLALHYIKYEPNFLKAYNILEDIKKRRHSTDTFVSLYLILFDFENMLLESYKRGSGYTSNFENAENQLNMLNYIMMKDLQEKIRLKIIRQTKLHIDFWKLWLSPKPDYLNMVCLATKSLKFRKKFMNKWKTYTSRMDPNFYIPLLTHGLYLSIVNNDVLEGDRYIELYQHAYVKAKAKADMSGLMNDTLFAQDSFYITMSATNEKMGKIMECSQGIETILGFKREIVINQPVDIIMTMFYREKHDKFLANYSTTGKQRLINTTHILPCRKADDSLISVYFHLKINPLIENGMSYLSLMRPYKATRMNIFILVREDGIIDATTALARSYFGYKAWNYSDGQSIMELCPDFWVLQEIFHKVLRKGLGLPYSFDKSRRPNRGDYDIEREGDETAKSTDRSNTISKVVSFGSAEKAKSKESRASILKSRNSVKTLEPLKLLEQGLGYMIEDKLFDDDEECQKIYDIFDDFKGSVVCYRKNIHARNKSELYTKVKLRCGLFARSYEGDILKFVRFFLDENEKIEDPEANNGSSVGEFEIQKLEMEVSENNFVEENRNEITEVVESKNSEEYSSLNLTISSGPTPEIQTERANIKQITFGDLISENEDAVPIDEKIFDESNLFSRYSFETHPNFPEENKRKRIINVLDKLFEGQMHRKDSLHKQNSNKTADGPPSILKNKTLSKYQSVMRKIYHKVRDPKITRKATFETENEGEQIVDIKRRLRRRFGTQATPHQVQIEASTASSVNTRVKKIEKCIKEALDVVAEKKWMLGFKWLFAFINAFTVFVLLFKSIKTYNKLLDWDHRRQVIENSYSRIESIFYLDEFSQLILAVTTKFLRIEDFLPDDFESPPNVTIISREYLRELILQARNFTYEANTINNALKLDVTTLSNGLQPYFYDQNVRLYEENQSGEFVYSYNDDAFRTIEIFVQKSLKAFNEIMSSIDREDEYENLELRFINYNSKNDLLDSTYGSTELYQSSIIKDIQKTTSELSYLYLGYFLLLILYFLVQFRYIFRLNADASYFGLIFLRFQREKIEMNLKAITTFYQALEKDLHGKQLAKEVHFEDNMDLTEARDSGRLDINSRAKKVKTRYSEMKRMNFIHIKLFLRLIPCILMMVQFMTSNYSDFTVLNQKITNLGIQSASSMKYLNAEISLFCQIIEAIRLNSTTNYQNQPILTQIPNTLELFADISALIGDFRDKLNNYQLDEFQTRIFYNYTCIQYAEDQSGIDNSSDSEYIQYYSICQTFTQNKGYTGLVEVCPRLYRNLKLRLEEYSESNKTKEVLRSIYTNLLREVNYDISLSRSLLSSLFDTTNNKFDSTVKDGKANQISSTIFNILIFFFITGLTWFYFTRKILYQDRTRKGMLKMVPLSMIIENRYTKSYLLENSSDTLISIKALL